METYTRADGRPLIRPGAGSFYFPDGRSGADEGMRIRYYLPPRIEAADARIAFVMHGVKRDAYHYRDNWSAVAEQLGFMLICPEFSKTEFPGRKWYQLGNMRDAEGVMTPEDEWTFGIVERLFDFIRAATGNAGERYCIYGHSAGAQYVHRLAMFLPDARFSTAVAANSGWYTMPTFEGRKWPYGLRKTDSTPEKLGRVFGKRLVILLGERDTDSEDPFLRTSKNARRQGRNRFERGHRFYETAGEEAARIGADLAWELKTVPDAAHLDSQMMPMAAQEFFRTSSVGTSLQGVAD